MSQNELDLFSRFTARRYASEEYMQFLRVHPSVRLSQAGTVPKRLNAGSRKLYAIR